MVKLKCNVCGSEFSIKPYRLNKAKYCSRRCKGIGLYHDMKEKGYGLALVDGKHLIGNKHRKGLIPTNAFQAGHNTWNKDIKGMHLSPDTEFKKGHVPANKNKTETITQRTDIYGTKRNFIKVAEPNVWESYATYLWRNTYGNIPEGYIIHHKNKNALDDRLDNFEMLTRAEHIGRHREDYVKNKNSRFLMEAVDFIS